MNSETKHAIRMILLTTSLGGMSYLSFNNGLLLAYFSYLGISSTNILILLSLFPMLEFVLLIPFSHLSDIYGKKRIGTIGMWFMFLGFFLLLMSSFLPVPTQVWGLGSGIASFGLGASMNMGNWFALLHPIIPENIRGRFFGRLRLTWQSIGFLFTFLSFYILELYPTLEIFQAIMATITILMAVRIIFYLKIPELEKSTMHNHSLKLNLAKVLSIPGFMSFSAYCFLLMLFTGAGPQLFSLIEKDVLNFTGAQIVFIGNLMVVGALGGFVMGGRMVDRFGTKFVFVACHLSFTSIFILFLFRSMFPFDVQITVAMLTILFGLVQAASGIAMTSEIMALITPENKSLASGVWFSLFTGGLGLSGLLSGQALKLGIMSNSWFWFGQEMSRYDGILLLCGIMTLIMTITLGLIPSMINRTHAQWIPQGS